MAHCAATARLFFNSYCESWTVIMKYIRLFLLTVLVLNVNLANATEVPLISTEEFNSEWTITEFPEVLQTEDGTPLFKLNVTVTLEWELDSDGQLARVSVIEELPSNHGYADIIITAMKNSKLEPRVSQPILPVRVRGTFEFRAL